MAGLDKTMRVVNVGFLPLTDCASVIMAAERGFDRKYGVKIALRRETSWASVRDKLVSGALDAAHVLYGLVYGVQQGIGCQQQDMAVLMGLSQNGQAITLARALAAKGATDGASLAALMQAEPRNYAFAQTFPTGNHAMLLNYWLAAHGIDPVRQARSVTLPPVQMVGSLREGMIDGFCVGEPWGQRAVSEDIGVTVATSQQIWPDHPGKVLGATAAFADADPDTCRALVAAVLDASAWIDASDAHRHETATVLAGPAYLNLPPATIAARLLGDYDNGLGARWRDAHAVRFYGGGSVNYPYLSDGMWFMTQQRRWGLVRGAPDYLAVAQSVNRLALYEQAAALTGTALPASPLRSATLIDGVVWDGQDPAGYTQSFKIHNM